MAPLTLNEIRERYGVQHFDHEPVPGAHVYEGEHDLERLVDAKRMDAILRKEACWRCTCVFPTGIGYGKGRAFVDSVQRGDFGGFPPGRTMADAEALVEQERCPICTAHMSDVMVDLQVSQEKR